MKANKIILDRIKNPEAFKNLKKHLEPSYDFKGITMFDFVKAMMEVQKAIISAQPRPNFNKGGLAIVGKNKKEIIVDKNGTKHKLIS